MYLRAPYDINIIILSTFGIVALSERRLNLAYTIYIFVLILILIHLTTRNSSIRYFIKYTYTL